MIKLRVAHLEDLILLAENSMDETLRNCGRERIMEWAKLNMDWGPAYAAEYNGKLIAAAGVMLTRPGLGDIWIVVDKDVEHSCSFWKEALRAMRDMPEIIAEKYGLKKIRSRSRIGFNASQIMLNHIGFERQRRATKEFYLYIRRF
jgi:hypothetical protein